jgi:hypothetical protein
VPPAAALTLDPKVRCRVVPSFRQRAIALLPCRWPVGRAASPPSRSVPSLDERGPQAVRTPSAGGRATARNAAYRWQRCAPRLCRSRGVSRQGAQRGRIQAPKSYVRGCLTRRSTWRPARTRAAHHAGGRGSLRRVAPYGVFPREQGEGPGASAQDAPRPEGCLMASIQKRDNGKWRARYRDHAGHEHARHFARQGRRADVARRGDRRARHGPLARSQRPQGDGRGVV